MEKLMFVRIVFKDHGEVIWLDFFSDYSPYSGQWCEATLVKKTMRWDASFVDERQK